MYYVVNVNNMVRPEQLEYIVNWKAMLEEKFGLLVGKYLFSTNSEKDFKKDVNFDILLMLKLTSSLKFVI